MKYDQAEKIKAIYDSVEESEPDISTERLLSMTVTLAYDLEGISCDVSDVVEALRITGE